MVCPGFNPDGEELQLLERQLENLHIRRCLLGPVIEDWIIRDRVEWIRGEMNSNKTWDGYDIQAVNLFDQATGSARNVALVLAPMSAFAPPIQ
jgi:hypothetical protein